MLKRVVAKSFSGIIDDLIYVKVFSVEKNRLFWGSRRGMLELDLVLMPFLENVYPTLEQADKELYWKLLECEDQDMFAWFLRREDPDDKDLKRIVTIVRNNTGLQPEEPK